MTTKETAAVDLAPTEEQEELRRTVRRFLAERSPESEVRRVMESPQGFDPGVWAGLSEMGVLGLAVPEEYGGAGYGFAELAVVIEEAGRAVLPAPLLSSAVLATTALLGTGDDDACRRLLSAWTAGERRGALALTASAADVRAEDLDGGVHLSGRVASVLDGHTADDLLVVVHEQGGLSLFAVEASTPGLGTSKLLTLDQTRPMATVALDGVRAAPVGPRGGAAAAVDRAVATARVALAAEAVGGGDAVLASAVGYALQRRQFGRLIGSFQAVKHLCADMLAEVELGRAAAAYAARVADRDDAAELAIASAVAKSWCCDAFVDAAGKNIQVHGGIGFTWEHSAHLYLKRAKTNQLLFGDGRAQRAALAASIGLQPN